MVAFILPANSATGSYEIDNSYRIDQGSAVGMARFGNNSRNGNTFTISFWIKRTKLGEFQTIVTSKVEDSGVNAFLMTFQADDTIKVQGQPASGTGAGASRDYLQTSAVYRDVSAWYHIVYRLDTTQSTASNRHRLYVNGVEQAKATDNPLDQNVGDAYFYNAGSYPYAIGNDERDNDYGNFYMAEHHYTDGVSNGPDAFGETNDNGVWIPKQYGGSHGTYGHYLKFKQSGAGSGTTVVGEHDYTTGTASTIGADSSGNDNHFHVQGYSVQDNTTDTPTNNFATLNPLSSFNSAIATEGNLEYDSNSSGGSSMVSTIAPSNGKWYVEVKAVTSTIHIGVSEVGLINFNEKGQGASRPNINYAYGGGISIDEGTADSETSFGANDIIGIALNLDDGEVIFYKNGTAQNSGTAYNLHTNTTHGNIGFSVQTATSGGNTKASFNFGNPAFAISSGNADANGYGNFEYAVPSGYYSLCTKNLAEFG